MLSSIRQLWTRRKPPADHEAPRRWAQQSGAVFKLARDAEGFVVEWQADGTPARMEWGASTRPYIRGNEVRLRAELELPADLQVLLLERSLMASLEGEVFAQATGAVQTRLDDATPQEMRWLVMLPALPLPADLQARLGAVSNAAPWLDAWLAGDLARELARGPGGLPFVLMINRSRITLRTAMQTPQVGELERLRTLFDIALRRVPAATLAWVSAESEGSGTADRG